MLRLPPPYWLLGRWLLERLPLGRQLLALCSAMLLAVVCVQAVLPSPMPIQRSHGSAFSATTEEVALNQARRAPVVQAMAPLVPPSAVLRVVALPVALTAAALPGRPRLRPDATGPPVSPLQDRPAPRAPPRP